MIFRQLFDRTSCTYTYLLADEATREALLIDTVKEHVDRDFKLLEDLDLTLRYLLETHIHADHITGAGLLHQQTGAQIVMGSNTKNEKADRLLADGEEIVLGETKVKIHHTPGHTEGCCVFYSEGRVFTGDVLFIRGCGRTDFQGGSSKDLFESVHGKIFSYSDETLIYPGHDYKGMTVSTVGEEKKHNPRLKMSNSLEDFEAIMNGLKLDNPKMMDVAVPANMRCGME